MLSVYDTCGLWVFFFINGLATKIHLFTITFTLHLLVVSCSMNHGTASSNVKIFLETGCRYIQQRCASFKGVGNFSFLFVFFEVVKTVENEDIFFHHLSPAFFLTRLIFCSVNSEEIQSNIIVHSYLNLIGYISHWHRSVSDHCWFSVTLPSLCVIWLYMR